MRKPGAAQSWLARGKLDLAGDTRMARQDAARSPGEQVKQVVLTQADGSSITIGRDKAGDKLALANMPKDKKLKYDSILDDAAGTLGGLQLDDVAPAKDFAFPPAASAMRNSSPSTARRSQSISPTRTARAGRRSPPPARAMAQKAAAELNTKVAPWIYALPTDKAKTLRDKLDDLVEAPKAS